MRAFKNGGLLLIEKPERVYHYFTKFHNFADRKLPSWYMKPFKIERPLLKERICSLRAAPQGKNFNAGLQKEHLCEIILK